MCVITEGTAKPRAVDLKEMAERGTGTWLIHQRFEERLNRFTGIALCIILLMMHI